MAEANISVPPAQAAQDNDSDEVIAQILEPFSGIERTAILLMTVGEEEAAEIMRNLGPKEVQNLGEAIASVKNVNKEVVTAVLKSFNNEIGGHTALGMGTEEYLRGVLSKALGEEKAEGVIDRILMGKQSKGLEALKWMEPRAIAEVIRYEHPQIIAIVLSYLEGDQAAEAMSYLPEKDRPNIMMRIASLEGIQPSALYELDDILEKQFSGNLGKVSSSAVGGIEAAAAILNFTDGNSETYIMDSIKEVDEELGQSIQDKMFVFENLADVDNRGIQTLLREVSVDKLLVALKGTDEIVKEKILNNMSKRAAEMLRDDLEAAAPVRLSDVEEAQREILSITRRLAESGDIMLGGGGDEYV